jgi:hypothetical protein
MSNFQKDRPLVVGWCVSTLSLDVASIRYRAILPAVALEAEGHRCEIFDHFNPPALDTLDVLIVVKNFSVEGYGIMQRANRLGIPVIFDLCDNIFVPGYGKYSANVPREMFKAIVKLISAVVVTTEPLAHTVEKHVGDVPVRVIPDGVLGATVNEALERALIAARSAAKARKPKPAHPLAAKARRAAKLCGAVSVPGLVKKIAKRWRSLLKPGFYLRQGRRLSVFALKKAHAAVQRQRTKKLAALPRRNPAPEAVEKPSVTAKRLLWFGNHGADYADFGIRDLLLIQTALETIAQEYDVELVVVSNNRAKYEDCIRPMSIPSRYVEWSPHSIEQEMRHAHVVLIPNSLDAFSVCKSANRSVHALTYGLPVIATNTPALAPLYGGIVVDDFLGGLRRYLASPECVEADVALGQNLANTRFGLEDIGRAWLHAIAESRGTTYIEAAAPDVIFVLHLMQDLDVIWPVILEAQQRSVSFEVWCSSALLNKSPRVLTALQSINVFPVVIVENQAQVMPVVRQATKAMLSAAETNLAPHTFTRVITERANAAGLKTATLQHGFENVGLTYSDEIHHVQKVNFAAKTIYIWGPLETLHPDVIPATKNKCVPVGCPKTVSQATAELDHLIAPDKTVVGIFENLHWHRYDDPYREFFLEGVQALAERFPEHVFLIKPHNAGLWLTKRYKGDRPVAPNLVIADPESREWQGYTADQLMGRMSAVITSPSTVALDAARRGLSVAVVTHKMSLDQYAPLPQIRTAEDWVDFVLELERNTLPDPRPQDFVKRTVIPGPTASKILDDLIV